MIHGSEAIVTIARVLRTSIVRISHDNETIAEYTGEQRAGVHLFPPFCDDIIALNATGLNIRQLNTHCLITVENMYL